MHEKFHPQARESVIVTVGRQPPAQKPGRSKQDYETPDEFIYAVLQRYRIGSFDIDLAASAANAKASVYYTAEDNALVQPWKVGTGWNWLNPEFTNIRPWVAYAYQQMVRYGAQTLMLVPASVGCNWFRDYVDHKSFCHYLNNRITFVGAPNVYPKDCMLIEYSPYADIAARYDVWDWVNHVTY